MNIKQKKYSQGFTLIELLVVVAIIGLLASIVLTTVSAVRIRAQDTKRVGDLQSIQTALELYYADHGSYPNPVIGDGRLGDGRYAFSYPPGYGWDILASQLAPYISLPSPSSDPAYSYAYFHNLPGYPKFCYDYPFGHVVTSVGPFRFTQFTGDGYLLETWLLESNSSHGTWWNDLGQTVFGILLGDYQVLPDYNGCSMWGT